MSALRVGQYLRVSTKEQYDSGMGTQIEKNLAMIEQLQKQGINAQIVATFAEGKSAYSYAAGDRSAIQDMLTAVANREIDAVIFFDESRLTRSIADFFYDFVLPAHSCNSRLKYYKSETREEWDPRAPSVIQELINAASESQKKSDMAHDVQAYLLRRHLRPGGRLPMGIGGLTRTAILPDSNYPVVLFIFELAAWGHSVRDIARIVADFRLFGESETLSPTTIQHILHNPIYIGVATWGRRVSKHNSTPALEGGIRYAQYPPLVPRWLWDLAQATLAVRTDRTVGPGDTSYVLRGLVRCVKCEQTLKVKNRVKREGGVIRQTHTRAGNPLRYYFCPVCEERYDVEQLEEVVLAQVSLDLAQHFSMQEIAGEITDLMQQLTRYAIGVNEELRVVEEKADRWKQAQGEDATTIQEAVAQVRKSLQHRAEEIATCREDLGRLLQPEALEDLLERILSPLDQLQQTERRHLLHMAIRSIAVQTLADGTQRLSLEYRNIPHPTMELRGRRQAEQAGEL